MREQQNTWAPAGRCGLIAADIVGFGRQGTTLRVQVYLRQRLYQLIDEALRESGIEFARCYSEDRGDGLVLAVPPDISTDRLLHPFADHLRAGLWLHNLVSSDLAKLRMRVAVHSAGAWTDAHGLVGAGVIHLFRILDAPIFKRIASRSGAYLALIASEAVYDEVIRHAFGLIDPDDYAGIGIENKETSGTGWVRLIGRAATLGQPA
jgi:hypothetical protein